MNKLFVKAPQGIKIQRHFVECSCNGRTWNEIRFTVNDEIDGVRFKRLVALARNEKFVWIHSRFSA